MLDLAFKEEEGAEGGGVEGEGAEGPVTSTAVLSMATSETTSGEDGCSASAAAGPSTGDTSGVRVVGSGMDVGAAEVKVGGIGGKVGPYIPREDRFGGAI